MESTRMKKYLSSRLASTILVATLLFLKGLAGGADSPVATPEPDWPQWRGPRRDAVIDETGLLDTWPDEGPPLLWKTPGMGRGWASPIIVGDTIYITGDFGKTRLKVMALDTDGGTKWEAVNGAAWKKSFPGSRGACCYSDGKVYNMNGHGRVACLDAATGEEKWAAKILERFGAKVPRFGMSECLLIDGDNLIVTPGIGNAMVAALDKKTGKTVWTGKATPQETEEAGYSSPILVTMGGKKLIVNSTSYRTFAADAATGKVLWTDKLKYTENACSTIPVLCGDSLVFASNTDVSKQSSSMLKVDATGTGAEKIWTHELRNLSGSGLYKDGHLYISGARKLKGFLCLNPRTGKTRALLPEPSTAAIIWADGKIIALSADGKVFMLRRSGDTFETLGKFTLVEKVRQKDAWAHPVLFKGRLYLRYHDTLFCYDVKK
jgi:outer membrane protein assembly factor BamB